MNSTIGPLRSFPNARSDSATASPGIAVDAERVARVFPGQIAAVAGIDLRIPAGEFIALLGPSGCGKTTLLRLIAGLDKPSSGFIRLGDGHSRQAASVGYVFQDAHLLPWRDALHNVALPLELLGTPRSDRLAAAAAALARVGLADSGSRYPAQLSGGMRMRASLARALVTQPDLLLLDEPFGALDEITRQELDEHLHGLWRSRGMTVIFVTHSITEAAFLAERAIVLTRRPARILLDHRLQLPPERTSQLRTDAAFVREGQRLFEALDRGQKAAA
jgi:NitT/TauT family transport system ATP-binding protein